MNQVPLTIAYLALASLALASPATDASGTENKPWTPEVSSSVRYFTKDSGAVNQSITISPDGSMFFFITARGELATDSTVSELYVFSAKAVKAALDRGQKDLVSPIGKIERRSTDHDRPDFLNPEWESDSHSIVFNGISSPGVRQLFRYDVATGKCAALTHFPRGIGFQNSKVRYGKAIVAVVPGLDTTRTSDQGYPVHVPSQTEMIAQRYPIKLLRPEKAITYVSFDDGDAWQPNASNSLILSGTKEGRLLIAMTAVQNGELPKNWVGYDMLTEKMRAGLDTFTTQFVLIDAAGRIDRPLFDAPTGIATSVGRPMHLQGKVPINALWSADETQVILVNTAVPLQEAHNTTPASMAYVVGVDVSTGCWEIIEPLKSTNHDGSEREVASVEWLIPGRELLIRHTSKEIEESGTVYALQSGHWIGREVGHSVRPLAAEKTGTPVLRHELTVVLRQDQNTPPMMFAIDGMHEIPLLGSDPALVGVHRVEQKEFEWRTPNGEIRKAGLLLPERLAGSVPPPLVVEAYRYEPTKFRPSGPGPNTYAGQSLVARGMTVLTISLPGQRGADRTEALNEPKEFVSDIESAADALAKLGLIDRTRVGLVGFSRAGYNIFYALTHPGEMAPAAAVIEDSFLGTISQQAQADALNLSGGSFADILYGGRFWEKKSVWLEHDGLLNIDRVRTPVILSIHDASGINGYLQEVGAFKGMRRPLEFLLFPTGDDQIPVHGLQMPYQQVASRQATVDWMCFWLKGEIPKDPERAARWAILRKQQDEVLKTPPPPKGKWVFQPDPVQPEWHPPAEPKKEEPKPEPTGVGKN